MKKDKGHIDVVDEGSMIYTAWLNCSARGRVVSRIPFEERLPASSYVGHMGFYKTKDGVFCMGICDPVSQFLNERSILKKRFPAIIEREVVFDAGRALGQSSDVRVFAHNDYRAKQLRRMGVASGGVVSFADYLSILDAYICRNSGARQVLENIDR